MENFEFALTDEARKDLEKLNSQIRIRILKKLKWFRNNFSQISPLPLQEEWHGFFKFRIGDWRVVYEIDYRENKIFIHIIDHRDKIYQRKIPRCITR
ncbi:type II toxin-antitoxin system RelE/ParE family toxin [Patescibacteria group bacterium]|nr:type II toxin-antitoxin system RelE/ParE family toxin [Patescibacteria group bacterium]